ncbi:MAG: hypothetical protein DCC75_14025 [Proteobacteria bacterium]|nr:MAG: hypothetical protein DCC75_14025 [Pseudomonadota bacterium]
MSPGLGYQLPHAVRVPSADLIEDPLQHRPTLVILGEGSQALDDSQSAADQIGTSIAQGRVKVVQICW